MKTKPKRAVRGTIGHQLPLRLTSEMLAAIAKRADQSGLSMAEWIRTVIASGLSSKWAPPSKRKTA